MLLPSKVKDRRCGFVVNGPESHRLQWGEELPTRVCDLRTPRGFNGYSEGEANARLIAAAPEMLDALRLALTCLDAAADGRLEDVKDEIGGTANIVDEAITRATQSCGEPVMAA
jgi:hypothetical protein